MSSTLRQFQRLCLFFCFLLALSACGQATTPRVAPKQSTPKTTTQTCPASITVRTIIPPPMPVGNHPNLIYQTTDFNASSDATTLLRYDTTTATTTTLLKGDIQDPSISPDGQWVIFVATIRYQQQAIQIVHISDQRLQTLYCAPAQMTIDHPLLSPDQNSLAFTEVGEEGTGIPLHMNLLDLKTGKLHTILSSQQPGFPSLALQQSPATQSSLAAFSLSHSQGIDRASTQQSRSLSPLSGRGVSDLIPVKWANNNSLFVSFESQGTPGSVFWLYLLRDISKDASQQQNNLQKIVANDDPSYRCDAFDVTPDSQNLVCSNSSALGETAPATISIRPVEGGNFHIIYQGPAGQITTNLVSNSTLLFTLMYTDGPDALWKVNTDGSGLVQLMTAPSQDWRLGPSVVSNGSLYALTVAQTQSGADATLMFGSLSGGSPKTIVEMHDGSVQAVGWTQL